MHAEGNFPFPVERIINFLFSGSFLQSIPGASVLLIGLVISLPSSSEARPLHLWLTCTWPLSHERDLNWAQSSGFVAHGLDLGSGHTNWAPNHKDPDFNLLWIQVLGNTCQKSEILLFLCMLVGIEVVKQDGKKKDSVRPSEETLLTLLGQERVHEGRDERTPRGSCCIPFGPRLYSISPWNEMNSIGKGGHNSAE